MSLLDQLRQAEKDGTVEKLQRTYTSTPQVTSTIPEASNPVSIETPIEVTEAVLEAEDTISTQDKILGTGAGVATELGLGMGMSYKMHQSQRYMKWLKNVSRLSKIGIVAPEGVSTATGVVGLALSEAAIWGFSNYIGQNVRKQFGLQDSISAGEMIASSVFGVGVVATGANKMFKLAPGVGSMNAWKGKEVTVNGVKTFMSGATLGLAESAMRQEIEAQLNGKERNTYDYLFSAAGGGAFNNLFQMWSKTGSWGRNQASKMATGAKNRLEQQKLELQERIDKATPRSRPSLIKQLRKLEDAQEAIDDSINEISGADKTLTSKEKQTELEPEPVTASQRMDAADDEFTNMTRKELQEAAKEADITGRNRKSETLREELRRKRTQADDVRYNQVDEFGSRLDQMDRETMSREMPTIQRDAKKLYNDSYKTMESAVRRITANINDTKATQDLLREIKYVRRLNVEVKDVIETTMGRSMQASRRDADRFNWTAKYSFRSMEEDNALAMLEDTLVQRLDRKDIKAQFKEFKDVKPRLKEEAKGEYEVTTQAKTKADKEYKEQLFTDLNNSFVKAFEADNAAGIVKGIRWMKQARQLSLINQIPSVMAGVPTAVGAGYKQFWRAPAVFMLNMDKGIPVAGRLAKAELAGGIRMLRDFKGNWANTKRTMAENKSATDNRPGNLQEDITNTRVPTGIHSLVAKGYASAQRQSLAVDNVSKVLSEFVEGGRIHHIMSLGVKGIQGVDESAFLQLTRGRLWAESQKRAILKFPDDPAKAMKYAEEQYNSAWVESDGLTVLSQSHEFQDEVNQIREELLFAANRDNLEDVYTPVSEKIIQKIRDLQNGDDVLAFAVNAMMPYVGVPIRGVYRGARYTSGAVGLPFIKAKLANPYNAKIKELQTKSNSIHENLRTRKHNKNQKETLDAELAELQTRIELAQTRKLKYNEEALTDTLVGMSLAGMGALAAVKGDLTGSLTWMTQDQREKTKMKPFHGFGSDYKAAMPWAFPIALAADIVQWTKLKNQDPPILTEEQDLQMVLMNSFRMLVKELPLVSGIKTTQELFDDEKTVAEGARARLIASYVPIPAQARKINKFFEDGGKVQDLKGATYWERITYAAFGTGVSNKKTDLFGNDIVSDKTWINEMLLRQAPKKKLPRTFVDEILATDMNKNIQRKPASLAPGIKMTKFRSSEGVTLEYAFAMRLRETTIRKQGRLVNVEEAVNMLLDKGSWWKQFEKGWETSNNFRIENQGLMAINKELNKYYNKVRKDILKDKDFMSDFINEDGQSILDLYEELEELEQINIAPISPLDILQ